MNPPTTQTAYVTSGSTVLVVDIDSGAITGTIEVGNGPDGIEVDSDTQTVAADPSTHTAWVVNYEDDSASVIAR